MTTREDTIARSGGQCEAVVLEDSGVRYRCGISPVEVHHLITRARGGLILDEVGETYHLLALCHDHHMLAHDAGGHDLLLDGYVSRWPSGVVYSGSDKYLSGKYPKASVA